MNLATKATSTSARDSSAASRWWNGCTPILPARMCWCCNDPPSPSFPRLPREPGDDAREYVSHNRVPHMNFDFSDEQRQLRDEARRFLSEKCRTKARRLGLD